MDPASTSAAALKLEIAKLSGAIDRHKSGAPYKPPSRTNVYVNPNYKPSSRPNQVQPRPAPYHRPAPIKNTGEKRDVVLNGVAFQSSGRSLVRKDLPQPTRPTPSAPGVTNFKHAPRYSTKPRSSRQRARPGRNLTLATSQTSYKAAQKRIKFSDKQCPRFTTTGSCSRGLTCPYQHDPDKIALCWPFTQGSCPNSAETCHLSHNPTPERTPTCMHFANNGRCNRESCPFPHVRLGQKEGVCRDFAVLGYCAAGFDCPKQHVRECPDFAEKGTCITKGCKLPHVIRANRKRQPGPEMATPSSPTVLKNSESPALVSGTDDLKLPTVEEAQLGDDFIPLNTFNESSEDDDVEDDDDDDDDDGSDEEIEET
ncbi:hypothetical protein BJ322DRAFT_1061198 [Thelephora terrestris]|uniref:C3H1-type domain-containing protein n=1 Tax=Thelephora terrestris TaxID=56493 RepID=A0A9P6HGS9_9AGAM|nr:hypothetical protein BJ322DRAFT_1061198 [Thelephora terrestris]